MQSKDIYMKKGQILSSLYLPGELPIPFYHLHLSNNQTLESTRINVTLYYGSKLTCVMLIL